MMTHHEALRLRKALERIFPECRYRIEEQSYGGFIVVIEAPPAALDTLEGYNR
jgi:hypothetical protein